MAQQLRSELEVSRDTISQLRGKPDHKHSHETPKHGDKRGDKRGDKSGGRRGDDESGDKHGDKSGDKHGERETRGGASHGRHGDGRRRPSQKPRGHGASSSWWGETPWADGPWSYVHDPWGESPWGSLSEMSERGMEKGRQVFGRLAGLSCPFAEWAFV